MNNQALHTDTCCKELSETISNYVSSELRKIIKIISDTLERLAESIHKMVSIIHDTSCNYEHRIIFNYHSTLTLKIGLNDRLCIPNAPPKLLEKIEVKYIWFRMFIAPVIYTCVIKFIENELYTYLRDGIIFLLRFLGVF